MVLPPRGPAVVTEHTEAPPLGFWREAVGGDIELVPYFFSIERGGEAVPARAYCNGEGKLLGLDHNPAAQALWEEAQRRLGVGVRDALAGPVVVFWGDQEFMDEM